MGRTCDVGGQLAGSRESFTVVRQSDFFFFLNYYDWVGMYDIESTNL